MHSFLPIMEEAVMVGDIGVMIAAYIFTRMLSLLTRSGERKESIVVKVFAVLTAILVAFVGFDLMIRGVSQTPGGGLVP